VVARTTEDFRTVSKQVTAIHTTTAIKLKSCILQADNGAFNKTSRPNVLVTLETEEDCVKNLFKTVRTTRRISEFTIQRVPDSRQVIKARQPYLLIRQRGIMSVCGTQTKPRKDVRGCDEMVGEVPRCLTMDLGLSCVPSCSVRGHVLTTVIYRFIRRIPTDRWKGLEEVVIGRSVGSCDELLYVVNAS